MVCALASRISRANGPSANNDLYEEKNYQSIADYVGKSQNAGIIRFGGTNRNFTSPRALERVELLLELPLKPALLVTG